MIRAGIHLLLHLMVPAAVARVWYRPRWLHAFSIMIATMLVDLDHLLADPIYDPNRCGIGFHPLHSVPAITLYTAFLFFPPLRLIGIGLLIHMVLDGTDCVWMYWETGTLNFSL